MEDTASKVNRASTEEGGQKKKANHQIHQAHRRRPAHEPSRRNPQHHRTVHGRKHMVSKEITKEYNTL